MFSSCDISIRERHLQARPTWDTTGVPMQERPKRPKVVIVGGGFGGLYVV